MGNKKNHTEEQDRGILRIGRRALLKLMGATTVGLPLAAYLGRAPWKGVPSARAGEPRNRENYWRDGYFVQENVDLTDFDRGLVRAKVDGEWRSFYSRPLSDDFIDWNFNARLDFINGMAPMCLDGPHSGCLATYGANRGDSTFTLNAAYKGFGYYPLDTHIEAALQEVLDNWWASNTTKLGVLRTFYEDRTMWDFRVMSSLELYTTQDFETHSFLNQMANPVATICYLAIPGSFELRSIARLVHPQDPDLSMAEMLRLNWVNAMHDFYHGGPFPDLANPTYIGCTYCIVEVFDNSPYPGLMGVRVQPPL